MLFLLRIEQQLVGALKRDDRDMLGQGVASAGVSSLAADDVIRTVAVDAQEHEPAFRFLAPVDGVSSVECHVVSFLHNHSLADACTTKRSTAPKTALSKNKTLATLGSKLLQKISCDDFTKRSILAGFHRLSRLSTERSTPL